MDSVHNPVDALDPLREILALPNIARARTEAHCGRARALRSAVEGAIARNPFSRKAWEGDVSFVHIFGSFAVDMCTKSCRRTVKDSLWSHAKRRALSGPYVRFRTCYHFY
jgi:hypothetical protein